jgi:hypothetical protein
MSFRGPPAAYGPGPHYQRGQALQCEHKKRNGMLLDFLGQEWKGLQLQIESLNTELEQIASSDPSCVRLQQIPGVGPLVSTAVVSALGNGAAFKKGREFAAWLGLVPRQWSTGARPGEVDERIGNQNCTQRGDRRHCQQTSQDQLGGFSERERLSAPAQSRVFQLDEVGSEILFSGVLQR